jgi:ElaA protein
MLMAELVWKEKNWTDITRDEWYAIAALRNEVFVVEQNCPYQDLDGKDQHSLHLWAEASDGHCLAYIRIVRPSISYDEVSIGRVVTARSTRGTGLGKELMKRGMEAVARHYGTEAPIRISAQEYLLRFYSDLGFERVGEMYLEDNIPHVEMLFSPQNQTP